MAESLLDGWQAMRRGIVPGDGLVRSRIGRERLLHEIKSDRSMNPENASLYRHGRARSGHPRLGCKVRQGRGCPAQGGHDEPILKRPVGFSDLSSRRTARHGLLVSGSDTSPALPMTLAWLPAEPRFRQLPTLEFS